MGASLAEGQVVYEIWGGIGCIAKHDSWRWRSELNRFGDSDFERIFREEFGKASLKVSGDQTNLFEQNRPAADLQIGLLVTDLDSRYCANNLNWLYNSGSSVLSVEWQVYSTSAGKVVARIPTTGGVTGVKLGGYESSFTKLLQLSFAENVRQLAANPEFRKIVLNPAARVNAGASAPGPLKVAFQRPSKATPLKQAAGAAVAVFAGDGMGSGVLISPDGYILTNHHVAGDSGRVRVRWADGSESVGEVVRADRRRDVALIKVSVAKGRPLALRRAAVELGENVYAIGTPLDASLQNTVTRGIVSATRMIEGQSFIQSDTPITNGNSGGPLIDAEGAVVGLSVSGIDAAAGSTLNFFIPINEALKALALAPAV